MTGIHASTDEPRDCGSTSECDDCPYGAPKAVQDRLDKALAGTSRDNLPALYISGPMSGLPGLNFEAFNDVARKLRAFGFPVLNPADFGKARIVTWEQCIARDCLTLSYARVVVLLPGWEGSRGAGAEFDHAANLGIPAVPLSCFFDKVAGRYYAPGDIDALVILDKVRQGISIARCKEDNKLVIGPTETIAEMVRDAERKGSRPPHPYVPFDEEDDDAGIDDYDEDGYL